MSKAIFFNVPTHGHVNPSLPLTAELVRRGEQIIYYLTEDYRTAVEATGAEFRAYENLPPDLLDDVKGNPLVLTVRMAKAIKIMFPVLRELLKREKPDYILHDAMAPWGWVLARELGIPSVSSMALLILNPAVLRQSDLMPQMLWQSVKSLPIILRYRQGAAEVKRLYGVEMPGLLDVLNTMGTITINYTSTLFQPSPETVDPSVKFVGPSLEARPDNSGFPFEKLGAKPVIYISLGTVVNDRRDFYETCFLAFGDSPWDVVLSIGSKIDVSTLKGIPTNFIVRSHVPQLEVLRRAALFITHGGMNSVHEGLYYHVPLVVIPQTLEQTVVAGQVVRLGAGVMVENERVSAESLRSAAEHVLSGAERVGESFRAAGGHKRAADEIFAMKQGHHNIDNQ